LDSDLAVYLKSLQLVDLMTVLIKTSNNDDEIHLQAYRILAVIMAESDIKQLQNSSRIASTFIVFIGNTIDGGVPTADRLHNNLRILNGKFQNYTILFGINTNICLRFSKDILNSYSGKTQLQYDLCDTFNNCLLF